MLASAQLLCPDMDDRDGAVRQAGRWARPTPRPPFLENAGSHWEAIAGLQEDSGDLGDAEEFGDGEEALSDGDVSDEDER